MNYIEFQKSIYLELEALKNRVRHLIGDAHWGEEGRYKETILKSAIKRFVPNNISIGTGFITGLDFRQPKISSQIDIIIYDNTIPVLFREGDFVITTPQNVRGIIEVKTKLDNRKFLEVVENYNRLSWIFEKSIHKVFKGLWSFEKGINIDNSNFKNILKSSAGNINHIALGQEYFAKYWESLEDDNNSNENRSFYSLYRMRDLSFSYFISNLLVIITKEPLEDQYPFLFPTSVPMN